jgi:hypothetical protein
LQVAIGAEADKLLHISRNGDDIYITGANLHVVNGSGTTHGAPNRLGNVIIGYNERRGEGDDRSGSHMLVVGQENNYSSYGGIVVGNYNTTSGWYASVCGGRENTASGPYTAVSGGESNVASDYYASVGGGYSNEASGSWATVSGGRDNLASGYMSAVSGGHSNEASGRWASVGGGSGIFAGGDYEFEPQ